MIVVEKGFTKLVGATRGLPGQSYGSAYPRDVYRHKEEQYSQCMNSSRATIETLRRRAKIVTGIRRFFDERNYLAVETPQLARRPIPEAHIELFTTEYVPPEYRER